MAKTKGRQAFERSPDLEVKFRLQLQPCGREFIRTLLAKSVAQVVSLVVPPTRASLSSCSRRSPALCGGLTFQVPRSGTQGVSICLRENGLYLIATEMNQRRKMAEEIGVFIGYEF